MTNPPGDIELILRLVLAALLGAGVGLEREIHGHPAGLRTHLLVSVGSAIFTVLSFRGFEGLGSAPVDPTRIAAQVVSGIGFLGAGAILKDGFTIRGLTTAASLWSVAALGMAAAVGAIWLALAGTTIVLISLWPLHPIADRLEGRRSSTSTIRVVVNDLPSIGRVREALEAGGLEVGGIHSRRQGSGQYDVEVTIRRAAAPQLYAALGTLSGLAGVVVGSVEQAQ